MANRLNYLNQIPQIIMNSKFIGYVGVVGNRQANEKMLGCCKNSWHQKRTSSKSKLKQSKPATNANYKSTKPMKSKSTSQFRNKSNI
jgi:hypothetical protein